MQKGITKELIFKESEKMIELHGLESFSVRSLSLRLDIKPASLYNHIDGIDEIYNYLAKKASYMMTERLSQAIAGKERDEAFVEAAKAYRKFAENKREYYLLLIKIRSSKNETAGKQGYNCFKPVIDLIKSYGMSKRETLHFIRSFRSFLHGFVEITHNGFMQKGSASKDETFEAAVKMFLDVLKTGGIK